jgi:hypothetical protein
MSILALTSDTLIGTPATGNLEYNGQFFGTDSNASRAQLQRIVRATDVASTSGTSIDFTGIPAWVERITVMFSGVSLSGTSAILIQGGNSGGVVSTGYISSSMIIGPTNNTGGSSSTAGFLFFRNSAAGISSGTITLMNLSSSTWISSHAGKNDTSLVVTGGGDVSISTLDRIRITTVNGTDAFDAGTVNIIYEG